MIWTLKKKTLISIHAPRGGSDLGDRIIDYMSNISIHAPRGGSDHFLRFGFFTLPISIHAPRGGSDPRPLNQTRGIGISIHAPRGGSDFHLDFVDLVSMYFNPRSPWGERLYLPDHNTYVEVFQSTLPVGGATRQRQQDE